MAADASMLASRLSLAAVADEDFEPMLAIRIEALRPSLERLGRFDPARARERLAAAFEPVHMRHIVLDGDQRIGFITLKPKDEITLRLEHFYLRDGHRGLGAGTWALAWAKALAGSRAIELSALRDSDANRFYRRHGFVVTDEDAWDLHYRWQPEPRS